jgi:drug/metabolite transporter (DMT)-like permease
MLLANLCFCSATFLCKLALTQNSELNGFDYMLPRGMALLVTSVIDMAIFRVNVLNVSRRGAKLLVIRSSIGAIGMPCYFIALKYLPMSKASIIVNFAPLLVPVLAYFILKEKIGIMDILALVWGFSGWVLINITKAKNAHNKTYDDMYIIGILLWVIALIARSFVPVTLRLMSTQLNPICTTTFFSVGVSISGIVWLWIFPQYFNFSKWRIADFGLFFISGMSNYGEQRFMTTALKYGKATILTPITYLNIAMLLIIDLVVFKYRFEFVYFIGFTVIVSSVLAPIFIKHMYAIQ